ncbi:PQQ-like beta-propeller repeat protein [Paenibacillus sp. Cedars]|uniref:PQQ-like beta-propeller repeat protein n=1 Tax=Paenibacillus sp. Cedars TaxID=1980674 RepID=UPI0011636341|nr:PQQ-like beta-propeller repeat protein [Paenibacillus sp. Cedars]AWP26357.1 hypothetical protein B9D94_06900 [Paenibacillus sp. Cedars]
MFRKRYGWITAISLSLLIAGCGNNSQSSGAYQGKAIEGIASVAWTNEEQFQFPLLEPTVTEKAMYVGDLRYLYSIDTKTGKQLWTQEVDGMISRPTVSNGTVSFIDNAGVHALNADSGELLWEHLSKKEVPYEMRPSKAAASSNHVFIPEQLEDGRITLNALDIKTGKESWSYGDIVSLKISPFIAGDKLYLPFEGGIHIINEKSGKELDTIEHGSPVSSVAVDKKLLVVSDLGGRITAYDLKSKKAKWSYENDSFEMVNRPLITLLDNKALLTEVKSGTVVMLDASNGKELWSKVLGDPLFTLMHGGTITNPIVAEETVYLAVFEGQSTVTKGAAGYSALLALDAKTGNELWRYQENDYIYYAPAIVDERMITVNHKSIKAYQGGPNNQELNQSESVVDEDAAEQPPVVLSEEVKAFEGQWSTPESDELAFTLSFTDDSRGTITYHQEGRDFPTDFRYEFHAEDGHVALYIGSEEKLALVWLYDSGKLDYRDNQNIYVLERSGISTSLDEAAETNLIDAFKGKWCDINQELCFEVVIDDSEVRGYLDYYQEQYPYQEAFKIPYMDEYEIVIEMEAGASQVSLILSDDKQTMTYESDFNTAKMTKQE